MRNPIVVGIDPLVEDDAPLVLAAGLARAIDAPLVAVAGFQHDAISNAVSSGTIEEDLEATARARLALRAGEAGAELVVRGGSSAPRVLNDVAEERHAALIVVGSTRKGTLGRVAPGSTADRLLHGSTCAVAVAPTELPADWAPGVIGAGFLSTDEANAALRTAAGIARAAHARLRVVTAVEPMEWSQSAVVQPYQAGAGPEAAVDLATRALERAAADLALDPPATTEVIRAKPVEALVALSQSCDLLVCGSRGYGALRSVLLGGVTHGLIRRSACPLVVIPRGATGSLAELVAGEEAVAS